MNSRTHRRRLASGGLALTLGCALISGCVTEDHALAKKNLMSDALASEAAAVTERYLVGCPDVLEVAVTGRKEFAGHYLVEPDGRINLGRYGRLRVEERTLGEIARQLGQAIGVSPASVRVRVAEYRSQQLVLLGQVIGWQRSIPYQGQETVLDLLQRVGGITPEAAPQEVFVVRAHLGGGRPEVFHVKLDAIVLSKNDATNIRLLPSDHVYVGETRQARIEKCIPHWLRPMYQQLWDLQPADGRPRPGDQAPSRWVDGRRDEASTVTLTSDLPPPAPTPTMPRP